MTNGARVRGMSLPRLGVAQRIMLLTAGVAAVAVLLFVIVVRSLPTAPTAVALPWVLWAAAFALSEALVVHVQWQREAHTFSVGDLVLAAGLFLTSPTDLVLAQVVGTAATLVIYRRQRGRRVAFNLAQYALGSCLAVLVFAGLSGSGTGVLAWLAALAAVAVATVTAALSIFAVITLSEGRAHPRSLWEMLALSLPFTIGSGAVGLVVARTVADDPAAMALLALPTILLVAAYRAYTGAREQQENLQLLHEVTSLLHSKDSQEALGDFLESVRSAFRAEMAEL